MLYHTVGIFVVVLCALQGVTAVDKSKGNVQSMDCQGTLVNTTSNMTKCIPPVGMTSVQLICDGEMMKIGFNVTELEANILPYRIRFTGDNDCDVLNASDTSRMNNGSIWMETKYSQCGVVAYEEGNHIVFEQHVVVEYGVSSPSSLIYRYFNDTYVLSCLLNSNITQALQFNVKDRKTIQTQKNNTASFSFDFKVMKWDTREEVSGLVFIGESLFFSLALQSATASVRTSPQNCYATKFDGSGRYDIIQNKCANPNDKSVRIISDSVETNKFSWQMSALRYFGNSDGVYIACEVLICKNSTVAGSCQRCPTKRTRRALATYEDEGVVSLETVRSPIIFIMNKDSTNQKPNQHGSPSAGEFVSKPEGIAVVVIIGVLVLSMCAFVLKNTFFAATTTNSAAGIAKVF